MTCSRSLDTLRWCPPTFSLTGTGEIWLAWFPRLPIWSWLGACTPLRTWPSPPRTGVCTLPPLVTPSLSSRWQSIWLLPIVSLASLPPDHMRHLLPPSQRRRMYRCTHLVMARALAEHKHPQPVLEVLRWHPAVRILHVLRRLGDPIRKISGFWSPRAGIWNGLALPSCLVFPSSGYKCSSSMEGLHDFITYRAFWIWFCPWENICGFSLIRLRCAGEGTCV